MLRSGRDVTVATIRLPLSQLLQHIKLLSPRQNDFFCREIKGDVLAEGISVVVGLQGLSLSYRVFQKFLSIFLSLNFH